MPGMAVALLILSILLLALGLWTPAMIIIQGTPSILAYQLVLISFPAWLLGGILSLLAHRSLLSSGDGRHWLALGLGAFHVAALVGCLLWQPEGIS